MKSSEIALEQLVKKWRKNKKIYHRWEMGWPPKKAEKYTWIEVLDWLKLHYYIFSITTVFK